MVKLAILKTARDMKSLPGRVVTPDSDAAMWGAHEAPKHSDSRLPGRHDQPRHAKDEDGQRDSEMEGILSE